MDIFIPNLHKKRALIIVDMQSGFLPEHARWITPNIQEVIEKGSYELFVEAVFHTEKDSLWDKQTDWTFELEPTIDEIKESLARKSSVLVTKTTKSAFKGDLNLVELFREKGIEEVHIAGVDANDCVLATAFESFDEGFFTYVIEECIESSAGGSLRSSAIGILRHVELTNHSPIIPKDS